MPAFKLRGLYAITDSKLIAENGFAETVEAAIKGGATIIQLREKNSEKAEIIRKGKMLAEITQKYKIPLIINDSPEITKKTGADGVHLGGEDGNVKNARKLLGENAIIGVSCYGEIERGIASEKAGANYVAFGTPYFTPTKPDRVPTPFEVLKEAKAKLKIPVFAIGGITPENVADVLKTGVDGIAVITAIFGEEDTEKAARRLTLTK
ncbi:MAG: thiamine phosphate synthase [Candidatus Mycalebacterium zealandia]|nr:MAG: thiamine phosphate synthase [Candidatus Mycalebacterium zealandia]